MLKKRSYLFILFSVLIIVSHNIIAHHHHHSQIEIAQQGENNDNADHNIFSFGQLDETYIHSNDQIQLNSSFVCVLSILSVFSFDINTDSSEQKFSLVNFLLLPDNNYYPSHSLRGPPIS